MKIGRYSDSYKPKDSVAIYREAEKLFSQKEYLTSFQKLLDYINNREFNTVSYSLQNNKIHFSIIQGSAYIEGEFDETQVTASCSLLKFEKPMVSFMRRLLEYNYSLYYSKYSFYNDTIIMDLFSETSDASPRKMFAALKEICLRADKFDDILAEDFKSLQKLNTEFTIPIDSSFIEIKYKYFKSWIDFVLAEIEVLNKEKYSGGISFMLLNLQYKIDHLLLPHGMLMHDLEKVSIIYNTKDNKSYVEKNMLMYEEFKKISEFSGEKVKSHFYEVKKTFSIVEAASHNVVADLINNEAEKVYWYIENDKEDIAIQILEFIATRSLYSYGLPGATIELFNIVLNITNPELFRELNAGENYFTETKELNKEKLTAAVQSVIGKYKTQFPELEINSSKLRFESIIKFIISLYKEMAALNYRVT